MDEAKEIMEAKRAGEKALQSLYEAKAELKKASNWGIADIFFSGNGGLISTFMKHSKMERARDCMNRAKYDLEVFNRELRDVSTSIADVDISGFLTFFDYMDNFIAEIMVQKRISDAAREVERAIWSVEDVLRRL
ncbi:MAG: hypothetical protein K6F82_05805 [Sphaerochaetaceae bacterium]|nr:hypothetical protein [Sphaerochaetaceae bacterium]